MRAKDLIGNIVPVINEYNSLDEKGAHERFSGITYDAAVALFSSDESWIQEDLMWMARSGFLYYCCSFLDAIETSLSGGRKVEAILNLLLILEFRGKEFTGHSLQFEQYLRGVLSKYQSTLDASADDAPRARKALLTILNGWPHSLGAGFEK
jgi:hypothetical protein